MESHRRLLHVARNVTPGHLTLLQTISSGKTLVTGFPPKEAQGILTQPHCPLEIAVLIGALYVSHVSPAQVAHPDFLSKAMATKDAVKKEAAKKESVTWRLKETDPKDPGMS